MHFKTVETSTSQIVNIRPHVTEYNQLRVATGEIGQVNATRQGF